MSFDQTIDVNMNIRYSFIINDPQIDDKTSHFDLKCDSNTAE